jgi:DNA-binding winged helix-turn-helix (wHTH) protein/Tol biopolymer transport system component
MNFGGPDGEPVTANKSFVFRFADVEVREREFCLVKAGEVLPVEPKTFRVLLFLLRNPQKLIAKEELLNAVWGNTVVTESSLTRTIVQLRHLLGDEVRHPRYIETVATVGYRFLYKVETSEDASGNLDTTGTAYSLSEGDFVETPADGEIVEAAANSRPQTDPWAGNNEKGGKQTDGERNRFKRWLVPGAALLAVGLAVAVWYLRRPLPPLRVTEYTRITHDGRKKNLAGTDGSRLYFFRGSSQQPIAQVAVSGGEIAPIPTALPDPSLLDVSPDGSSLLVSSFEGGQASLWSVQMPAGSLRQLLTEVEVVSAAWSPDGKSVVYCRGNNELYVIRSDGTGNRKLADVGGSANTLSWSPDASKIRFFKDGRLWEILSDGSGLHPLLPGWSLSSSQCCGRWTPDGKFYIFLLQHPFPVAYGPGDQLWTLDERRGLFRRAPTAPVQLTSGPIRWNTPIPSKDGTRIFAQGVISRGELVRFDAQSNRLVPWLGGISAEFVTFSPDGQFVAYVTFPEGIMWRANRDGSNPVQLTDPPLYPINPRWSPDGAQILFLNDSRSYIVPSQGGGTPRELLPEEKEGTGDATWSPDGRKIVFSSLKSFEAISSLNYVLRVLDLGSHRITTLPGSEATFSPRWSPDGRFIAGIHLGASGGLLRVFDFETQRWLALPPKGKTHYPTWSSNSQFIYFLRVADDPGVFRVRVSDGVEERVVDLKGFRFTGGLGGWMGLDPDDTPMLMRDTGTADIYALTLEQK